jgi:virulence factor
MDTPLRIALIGLGSIARKAYLPLLTTQADVTPVFCTRDARTLSGLARQYRVRETYSELDALIRSRPDAAMVHSATESHATIVRRLLEADIPVFVDKPLTYSLAETEQLLELAARRQQILYLGFNRRFAPLVRSLAAAADPVQVSWQKNRVGLPDDPRVFIFDDFIHVLDSLRFLAPGPLDDLQVAYGKQGEQLAYIHVRWQRGPTIVLGGMNRISGVTEERIEYYSPGHQWVIEDLHGGVHYAQAEIEPLQFGNWETTLYKRGFVDMIADWLHVVQTQHFDPAALEDIRATHRLCETLVERVLAG